MDQRNKPKVTRDDYLSEIDNKIHYISKIELPQIIFEGSSWIKFTEPLVLECYCIDDKDYGYKVASFSFDFGMNHVVPLEKEHNFILKGCEDASDEEKIAFDVIFDLFHAFFHTSCDPNYEDYHWALYGNLKDRVEIGEE